MEVESLPVVSGCSAVADCAHDESRPANRMKPRTFMLIAGDPSGDRLAAELVNALRQEVLADSLKATADAQPLRTALAPRFFGAGGPEMAAAGRQSVAVPLNS